jgi:YtkA-like
VTMPVFGDRLRATALASNQGRNRIRCARAIAAVLCAAACLCACPQGSNDAGSDGGDDEDSGNHVTTSFCGEGAVRVATTEGGYEATYVPSPDPIPLNEQFDLDVTVTFASDLPVDDDVEVDVDARMPAHNHGMNTEPVITKVAAGSFHVDGMNLHMPGEWELYVDVYPNGISEDGGALADRATFVLECVE